MFPEGRALEFLLAAVVALIVVGPKDLPVLLRKLGQFMAKLRSMAAEFRASFDEMARQSELDDLRKEVEAMRRGQLTDLAQSTRTELDKTFGDIHQELTDVGVQLHPPMSYQYAEPAAESEPAVAPKPKRRAATKGAAKSPAKAGAAKSPAARKTSTTAAAKPAPKPRARKAEPKA
ncbi:twin-arginine translocase subunit TatB [Phenylobacterium hankyongense]|uniref:Sec-independent protein translocase protein TatB n=1 Tax=Phenylobacterium hankyongense TaxID=1813876 RepID=A0A328B3B1_9CAUL|nr:twin-arginine translocase subunit TatB [Phenylobacterium hankyongense]